MTSSILKISEAASLALHTAVYLADNPDRLVPTREMAAGLAVSEAHLAKVLQRLVHAGLARSTRGPKGGFALARPAEEVTLLEVYEAIEGPLKPSSCLFGDSRKCNSAFCVLGDLVARINHEVKDYLSKTYLSQMTGVLIGREHAA